ncbi:hypothetical protein vec25_69 [Escherichia phage VEc25]|uniref:Uncharacterized protein n=1 Tax=Escherichia phage VEc25 TaxID=2794959 RepID=A0A7U3T210_9CAUD|nr:hypothetical protein vec25_69 [Escherichia phage VEc25]
MSIEDYLKGKNCLASPNYDPDDQHSSWREDLPQFKKDREHLTLVNTRRNRTYNTKLNRFDPEYWVVDYNALMVATIIPYGSKSFKVPCQWRTNKDFLGVRWMTEDTFDHHLYRYETDPNYLGLILAFRHNPDEPDKFTVTIQTPEKAYTYRLAPYGFNNKTRRWECLDTKYGTKRTYQADIFVATDEDIPESEMTEVYGTKDYIFILDFADLRTGVAFNGVTINPRNITMISFDCTEAHHGLGKDAYIAAMYNNDDGATFQMEIGGIHTNAALAAGDKLQCIWRYLDVNGNAQAAENEFEVVSYEGFGTSNFSVKCKGMLPGKFIGCDAFYGKYLQTDGPIKQVDSVKWFTNLTVSGSGRKQLGQRKYPQVVMGMGMTSGFDDGYNLTPERQVKMAYGLGYRDWWTTYIGMSHYWKGLTAFQDKETGELITEQTVLDYPILFAGESQVAIHFMSGAYPDRGYDVFQKYMTETWGINYAGVRPINGTTGSTAVDRACAVNPDSEVFDPTQSSGAGGLWWWDLEADKPGPALLHCVAQVGKLKPKAIIWGQGDQDATALAYPGDRNPAPSLTRTKQATKKVFEYLRSLYGQIPIFIQELSYAWGITNTDAPNVPIRTGLPSFLAARRNTWGDIEFRWKSYGLDPALAQYRIEIYNPSNLNKILHSFVVSGTQEANGYVYADFTVEDWIPVMMEAVGSPNPWEFMKWRVVCLYQEREIPSAPWSDNIPLDNAGLVKKTILVGINQFGGGHFTDMSDPTATTANGAIGRKDKVSASTLRLTFAEKAGLRPIQVMPINVAADSAGMTVGTHKWWNTSSNSPGDALLAINDMVKGLGVKPDYFIEANPWETMYMKDVNSSTWPALMTAFESSNKAMLAWMRTNWGNPNLEIWFQGATTVWFGVAPPNDLNSEATVTVRDKQIQMATANIGFKLGSFVPGSNLYTAYRNVESSWIYYTVEAFHATAIELGEALALNINRATNPPDWSYLRPPANLQGRKLATRDIKMTWDNRAGITHWKYANRHVTTGAEISSGILTSPEYVFTLNDQQNAYNGDTLNMSFSVSEYAADSGAVGASSSFVGVVQNGSYMQTPTQLKAAKQLNGDIIFTWVGRPSWQHFWVVNTSVNDSKTVIFSKEWSSESLTWTVAEQNEFYGLEEGGATHVIFMVSEYDPSNGLVSIGAQVTGQAEQPSNPMNPVAGLYAVFTGDPGNSNIKIMWNKPSVGGRDVRIRNMHVTSNATISDQFVSDNNLAFTREEQVAAYGFTASSVSVRAQEHDIESGALGLTTEYVAVPETAGTVGQGFAKKDSVGNCTMSWEVGDAVQWQVEIINAENSTVVKTEIVVAPTITWTAEEITAEYGYLTDHMVWRVRPYRADGASNIAKQFDMTATL